MKKKKRHIDYERFLIAAINRPTHPTIKQNPPSGVTGPNQPKPSNPISERMLNKYNDPENNRIPTVKAMKEIRIEAFLALEKVDKNKRAKV